jgi:RHS repeat-associated protein
MNNKKTIYQLLFGIVFSLFFSNNSFTQEITYCSVNQSFKHLHDYLYLDNDKDGIGSTTKSTNTVCTYKVPAGYSFGSSDCDDNNASIIGPQSWYLDADGDTFGNSNTLISNCTKPTTGNYVLTLGDLNDANACITNTSPQTWYLDGDKDGFGTASSSVSCSIDPSTPTVKYALNNTDCDDNNKLIKPTTRWYQDLDGDTYGNPAVFVAQCTQPAGYVANNLDTCPTVKGSFNGCLIPDANFSADQNYILTMTPKVPVDNLSAITQSKDLNINITYYDGLGRPVQQIAGAQSATGKDIVTHIEYDAYGRQTREYLPYASSNSSLLFDPLAQNNTLDYYKKPNYDNTTNPYSEKLLEASPLNRVLQQAAPGNDWKLGSTHEIKLDYQTNSTGEVRLYQATTTWNATTGLYDIALTNLTGTVFYTAGELYKNITYDENTTTPSATNGTIEFKDKEGRVVLKRTFENNVGLDTYYVYDIYGNLTYVIPPLAAEKTSLTTAILDGLCYQYRYDHRNRLAEKKLPGKQWEFIVYDKLDRVVATGPAVSPFTSPTGNGWLLTKYDAFNRPVLTAWWPSATVTAVGRKTLQDSYNSPTAILNETKIATATNTTVNGVAYRYSNTAYPNLATFHVLTVNYYDDYNYPNAPTLPASVEGQTVYYNNTIKPIGLPTGSWTRVPETSSLYKSEISYSLYDSKARPIRSYTTNHLGGYTYVDSSIDFAGKTLYTITRHKRLSTSTELVTREDFSYSDQDRLLTQSHQINSQAKELLANNSYNELGQLTSKKVGSPLTPQGGIGTWLQNINYSYNIRGWLTGINDINNLTDATTPPSGAGGLDLFGFKINYNTPATASTTALFNGNIAETYWKTANDDLNRGYAYQYDNLNRLKAATYQKAGTVTNAYNESLTYDKNGNILTLNRNGTSETATAIDNLAYTYSHNQLLKVADTANKTQGFVDGTNTDNDFTYDVNGNMTIDKNKGITAITYNHLNLPIKITFGTTGNIVYVYNATGQKLKKVVTQGTAVTTTDYLGGYQYLNNTLQFFPTAEGYVSLSGTTYSYTYQYKDHLGNIRLSYSDANNDKLITNNEIVEESNYYPFGLKQTGYNNVTNSLGNSSAQKYKYNGSELQDELGLNMYDYGARNYDATIGRWMNIDPLAEKMANMSPYNYTMDNPMFFTDPNGMEPYVSQVDRTAEMTTDEWLEYNRNQHGYSTTEGFVSNANKKPQPTALELAKLSKHVYGDNNDIGGYEQQGDLYEYASGFRAALYKKGSMYVLAIAGTEDLFGPDGLTDAKQLVGLAKQYGEGLALAKDLLKDSNIRNNLTVTGHSLGGGIANYISINTGIHAVTFNAAGLSFFTTGFNRSSNTDAYILRTDPLNAVQGGLIVPSAGGRKHYLTPDNNIGSYVNGHSIDHVIEALTPDKPSSFSIKQTINTLIRIMPTTRLKL